MANPLLSNVLANTITKDLVIHGQEAQLESSARNFNQLAKQAGLDLKRKYMSPFKTLLQEILKYPSGLKAGPASEIAAKTIELEPPRNNWTTKRIKPVFQNI